MSNNVAEYKAVSCILELLNDYRLEDIEINTASDLIVHHMKNMEG